MSLLNSLFFHPHFSPISLAQEVSMDGRFFYFISYHSSLLLRPHPSPPFLLLPFLFFVFLYYLHWRCVFADWNCRGESLSSHRGLVVRLCALSQCSIFLPIAIGMIFFSLCLFYFSSSLDFLLSCGGSSGLEQAKPFYILPLGLFILLFVLYPSLIVFRTAELSR
ncbi:uncharacterized protein BDW47DRAFT_24571 [Aspergillus candidus]|uniref:Uncharacterized protein n=1 Tax=Aspergillus candidus TaxID=41067 RepID=A0A2I2FN60_ASPCN|nr:hypothetical protein BDW47DRAFT_24571 [Aspergillus candidus]PLB42073.1 hypothetical protein BDW47DRAFT_24571 [Aspergillus candidus]